MRQVISNADLSEFKKIGLLNKIASGFHALDERFRAANKLCGFTIRVRSWLQYWDILVFQAEGLGRHQAERDHRLIS